MVHAEVSVRRHVQEVWMGAHNVSEQGTAADLQQNDPSLHGDLLVLFSDSVQDLESTDQQLLFQDNFRLLPLPVHGGKT